LGDHTERMTFRLGLNITVNLKELLHMNRPLAIAKKGDRN